MPDSLNAAFGSKAKIWSTLLGLISAELLPPNLRVPGLGTAAVPVTQDWEP